MTQEADDLDWRIAQIDRAVGEAEVAYRRIAQRLLCARSGPCRVRPLSRLFCEPLFVSVAP
jgi:hypothetical protein